MKINQFLIALILFISAFSACKKDEPQVPVPTADKVEIGLANNKRGVIGADFHFNADVMAADEIANVEVKILQKSTETYSKAWKLEIAWDQYKGLKNTTVHKHFTIPADAPAGIYDFFFIVTDQNGSKLEIREDFTIAAASNVP